VVVDVVDVVVVVDEVVVEGRVVVVACSQAKRSSRSSLQLSHCAQQSAYRLVPVPSSVHAFIR